MKQSKKIVIILGPPGSGKGTQASLLADRLGFHYLETSKIIEKKVMKAGAKDVEIVNGKEYLLLKEKKYWEEGILCSPPLIAFWMNQEIKRLAEQEESIVFAGSPRTLPETQEIMPVMADLYRKDNISVVLFELKPEDSIYRNSHRRICKLFRHPILYNEETKTLTMCPLDGSKLLKREKLDDPETIKIRLKEYRERTLPIIDYFENNGYEVKKIDASPSPADVFNSLIKSLQ